MSTIFWVQLPVVQWPPSRQLKRSALLYLTRRGSNREEHHLKRLLSRSTRWSSITFTGISAVLIHTGSPYSCPAHEMAFNQKRDLCCPVIYTGIWTSLMPDDRQLTLKKPTDHYRREITGKYVFKQLRGKLLLSRWVLNILDFATVYQSTV